MRATGFAFTGILAAAVLAAGYLQLTFWAGVAALFIWPYFLGVRIASLLAK